MSEEEPSANTGGQGLPYGQVTESHTATVSVFNPAQMVVDFGQTAFAAHIAVLDAMMSNAEAVRRMFAGHMDWMREYLAPTEGVPRSEDAKAFVRTVNNGFQDWLSHQGMRGESPRQTAYRFLKVMMNAHYTTLDAIKEQVEYLPAPMRAWVQCQFLYNQEVIDMFEQRGAPAAFRLIGKMLPGAGELHHDDYNGKFLAEDRDGTLTAVDADMVAARFASGQPRPLPRVILTSSHAQGESLKDATSILHGIEAMARDAGHPLQPALANELLESHQTLVMMACDTDRNPFLNAGHLGNRMTELTHTLEGHKDEFETASPGAPRIARFILKCMAEDQSRIDIADTRRLKDVNGNEPIILQTDARDIIDHLMLWGYSKGGNVVSDAARYLIDELHATNAQGHSIIKLDESRADDDPAEQAAKRELVEHLKLVACAAREKAISPELKAKGMRRIAFNNRFDPIIKDRDYQSSTGDVKIVMDGDRGTDAHKPERAMGTRAGEQGFFLKHPQIRDACAHLFDPARSHDFDPNRYAPDQSPPL